MAYDAARSDTLRDMRLTLDKLAEQIVDLRGEVATREDLKALVTLAQYNADQRALNDRQQDHAQRLAHLEQGQRDVTEKMHAMELATVTRSGRAATASVQSQMATRTWLQDALGNFQNVLLGAFLTGFVTLLVYVATHH